MEATNHTTACKTTKNRAHEENTLRVHAFSLEIYLTPWFIKCKGVQKESLVFKSLMDHLSGQT